MTSTPTLYFHFAGELRNEGAPTQPQPWEEPPGSSRQPGSSTVALGHTTHSDAPCPPLSPASSASLHRASAWLIQHQTRWPLASLGCCEVPRALLGPGALVLGESVERISRALPGPASLMSAPVSEEEALQVSGILLAGSDLSYMQVEHHSGAPACRPNSLFLTPPFPPSWLLDHQKLLFSLTLPQEQLKLELRPTCGYWGMVLWEYGPAFLRWASLFKGSSG